MKAPQFSLPDQNNQIHTLGQYKGTWIILYFYPKDDTPGCTKEACGFRDNIKTLSEKNIVVLGVSKDTTTSHKKFADKFSLPFPLLSDTSTEIIKAYGAWGEKKFMGRTFQGILRNTVLINPQGEIQKIYEKVNPIAHAEEIVKDVDSM
jgi:thioredoxin-dependent peroxiredoxin